MRPPREDTEPWYKQFWPWFLISLPLSVVIASIITINIAVTSNDGLVSDDYYKEGLGIHKTAGSSAKAGALGIAADVIMDAETGALAMVFDKPLPARTQAMTLKVIHPTQANRDQAVSLEAVDERHFRAQLEPLGPANWKLDLRPADEDWRIQGRLLIPGDGSGRMD